MPTIRIGEPTSLDLPAAPTAARAIGPMASKKGKAMATPVPLKNERRFSRLGMGASSRFWRDSQEADTEELDEENTGVSLLDQQKIG